MLRRIFIRLWLFCLALLTSTAHASNALANGSNLVVNGVPVIQFETPLGSLSPGQRASLAAEKLRSLPFWGAVDVGEDGDSRSLLIGQEVILKVTAEDAGYAHATLSDLARKWASKLQDALNLPPLKVSDNFARLPVGKSQLIVVTGSESQRAVASVEDPKIAKAIRAPKGFLIEATAVGSTLVSIQAGKSQENIEVTVLPYAVELPQSLSTEVTGSPASSEIVAGAVDSAVKTKLVGLPDAAVTYTKTAFKSLAPGETETYAVEIEATSPTGISSKGVVKISVLNRETPTSPADFLWYSNSPETLKQTQSLFSATLKPGVNVRLLYHHMNGTMQDLYFRAEVVNESKTTAILSVIYGDSKPSTDPVRAGFSAACQFMRHWMTGSGDVITIPPGSVVPISLRRLSPGETASGLCQLRLIGGAPDLLVRTDSLPPLRLEDRWANTIFTGTPWHEVGAHKINDFDNIPCEADPHVYADPHVDARLDYVVGGRRGYYRIGQQPLSQVDQEGSLDGNFGVFDTISASVSNPEKFATDVELVFEASAGYAAGVFALNGQFVSTSLLKPKGTQRIAKFHLAAGAVQTFKILTFPISGSSYPATLTMRPILPKK